MEKLLAQIKGKRLIVISGAPGSGKSYIANKLAERVQNAVVLSIDGYHILRNMLDQQGLKIRGHISTFDLKQFKQDFTNYKKQFHWKFPTFDHSLKDPVADALQIYPHNVIILEGLWVFDENLLQLYEGAAKIWIRTKLEQQTKWIIRRHVQTGVTKTEEEGRRRFEENDFGNGILAQKMISKVEGILYYENEDIF